ncbi:MAG: chitobiase/beta-hexosaminidase C-terminal domain-containing protein, partial [Magnetococcales bacterium]|nr:chitobiase/beta-hexosaminidase C-terminal domain-containing protein [Magnetococcales bacterium]
MDYFSPQQVNISNVIAIAAGGEHALFLKADGTVWAAGRNNHGQIGEVQSGMSQDEIKKGANIPVKVGTLSNIQAIAAGSGHSLALDDKGTVHAWGRNWNGQLCNSSWNGGIDTFNPIPVTSQLTNVNTVAAGANHTLAVLKNGTVQTCGLNSSGQLGNDSTVDTSTPVQVKDLFSVARVWGGENHSVALKTDGTVMTWGGNGFGQLGNATGTVSKIPVQAMMASGGSNQPLGEVVTMSAGSGHVMAVLANGNVLSWGDDHAEQLGFESIGSTSLVARPVLASNNISHFNLTQETSSNTPPTIQGTPVYSVAPGALYQFTPQAGDPDGDNLTFSIQNKPVWATFDTTTGQLSGKPTQNDLGTVQHIVISVTDHIKSASVTLPAFNLSVSLIPQESMVLYQSQELGGISNALFYKGKIAVLFADGAYTATGYPDSGTQFSNAKLFVGTSQEDSQVLDVDTSKYVANGMTSAIIKKPNGDLSMVYRKWNGSQYAFVAPLKVLNGATLTSEPMDSTSANWWYHPSLAYDSKGNGHMTHYGFDGYVLRYSTNASGSWVTSVIIGPDYKFGEPSLFVDSSDTVHVIATDSNSSSQYYRKLVHFVKIGSNWTTEILADDSLSSGNLIVESDGTLRAVYLDISNNIKFVTKTGLTKTIEVLGNLEGVAYRINLVRAPDGSLHVMAQSPSKGIIELFSRSTQGWNLQTIATEIFSANSRNNSTPPSLIFNDEHEPFLVYADSTKIYTRQLWRAPTVTSSEKGGLFSHAVDVTLSCTASYGCADVRYTLDGTDPTNQSLLYATTLPVQTSQTLKFRAVDRLGNYGRIGTESFTIDLTLPLIAFKTPFDQNDRFLKEVTTISGTTSDSGGSGILDVKLQIHSTVAHEIKYLTKQDSSFVWGTNPVWITPTDDSTQKNWSSWRLDMLPGTWSHDLTYTIDAEVSDQVGNKVLTSRQFQVTDKLEIRGTIVDSQGIGVPNIKLNFKSTDGNTLSSANTNSQGEYTTSLPISWSGSVTPDALGIYFSPEAQSVSNLEAPLTQQNFIAHSALAEHQHFIIVAGGGKEDDLLKEAINLSADMAYRTLLARHVNKDDIRYFNAFGDRDVNGDGMIDTNGSATIQALEKAITEWAVTPLLGKMPSLVLYFVGHGVPGEFIATQSEKITALDLAGWLNQFQNTTKMKTIFIYDSCFSGSFLPFLATPVTGQERINIASTQAQRVAIFDSRGDLSFSHFFWSHVFMGQNLKKSFLGSMDSMLLYTTFQQAMMDANGDGTWDPKKDATMVEGINFGDPTWASAAEE